MKVIKINDWLFQFPWIITAATFFPLGIYSDDCIDVWVALYKIVRMSLHIYFYLFVYGMVGGRCV